MTEHNGATETVPVKPTSGSGRWSMYRPAERSAGPLWEHVRDHAILSALIEVTSHGAALLFGTTRDGGSLVVTLCDGDQRIKFYARTANEMTEHLLKIADAP